MLQHNERVIESECVPEVNVEFDAQSLEAIYRIVRKSMNGRTKVAGMDVDDLVQAVLLAIIPIYFVVPHFGAGHEREPLVVISSFLLLPFTDFPTILVVAWTLVFEVFFYFVFFWKRIRNVFVKIHAYNVKLQVFTTIFL